LDWPYGALRGAKDGHHIASHTWSHKLMTSLTNDEVLAELYYAQKAVKFVTGLTPKYWRPVSFFLVLLLALEDDVSDFFFFFFLKIGSR
jgi:hypothetical protein